MNKLNSLNYPLLSILLAMTACDDAQLGAEDDGLGGVEFRCVGTGCNGGNLGNTNVVGGYLAMQWPKSFGVRADNGVGQLKFVSASVKYLGATYNVIHWDITNDGHLRVYIRMYSGGGVWTTVTLEGTDVIGTAFNAVYEPVNGPSFNTLIKVVNASCGPGKYAAGEVACRYTLGTNTVPIGPGYPGFLTFPDLYPVCKDDDNRGLLSAVEKIDVIFAKNTRLDALTPGGDITADSSVDLAACLNTASSKSWWFLNVTYDWLYDPHARALDPSQLNAILHAWTAWFSDAPWTEEGRRVCFDDGVNELFSFDDCWAGLIFEGAHNASIGQVCRAQDGSHRHVPDALNELPYYANLPICPLDYTQADGAPTIGVYSVPALPEN